MRNANTPVTYDMPSRGYGSAVQSVSGKYTFPAATVTTGTALSGTPLFVMPKGARLIRTTFKADDADSNGTPTIVFSVGDAGSANRYLASSNIAQTGGTVQTTLAGALDFVYTADTPIFITINTQAATQTAGAQITVFFEFEEA